MVAVHNRRLLKNSGVFIIMFNHNSFIQFRVQDHFKKEYLLFVEMNYQIKYQIDNIQSILNQQKWLTIVLDKNTNSIVNFIHPTMYTILDFADEQLISLSNCSVNL